MINKYLAAYEGGSVGIDHMETHDTGSVAKFYGGSEIDDMEAHDTGSVVKLPMDDESMDTRSRVPTVNKLKVTSVLLINNTLVILFMVMLYYLLPTSCVPCVPGSPSNVTDSQAVQLRSKAVANGTEVPLGSITAWTPSPTPEWIPPVELPAGWQICNGSRIIDSRSPWVGQITPNLTRRFLRGGDFSNFLTQQEDQVQDHEHLDRGHTHLDLGHTHNDTGHTHNDSGHTHTDFGHTHIDEGHDHTDSGHTHSDAGHNHGYKDVIIFRDSHTGWGPQDDDYDSREESKTSGSGYANIQTGHAVITEGQANISMSYADISTDQALLEPASAEISPSYAVLGNSTSNIEGVVPDVLNAKVGSETRPKSTYVIWIMKIFEPVG